MAGGNKFQARLDSQKAQLERNGYSAEVVVRTTPEATDMINFARLWEHLLITADRRTRGYMSADKRKDYEQTQKAFLKSVEFMIDVMKEEIARHGIDLTSNNFISRVAQRYNLAEAARKKAKKPTDGAEQSAAKAEAKPAAKAAAEPAANVETPQAAAASTEVDGL